MSPFSTWNKMTEPLNVDREGSFGQRQRCVISQRSLPVWSQSKGPTHRLRKIFPPFQEGESMGCKNRLFTWTRCENLQWQTQAVLASLGWACCPALTSLPLTRPHCYPRVPRCQGSHSRYHMNSFCCPWQRHSLDPWLLLPTFQWLITLLRQPLGRVKKNDNWSDPPHPAPFPTLWKWQSQIAVNDLPAFTFSVSAGSERTGPGLMIDSSVWERLLIPSHKSGRVPP